MQKAKLQFKIQNLWLLSFGFVFALLNLNVRAAEAATVYFEPQNPVIYEGDTFIVRLKISSPDEAINAAEGTITYDSSILEAREVSTGASIFSLWPQYPAPAGGHLDFAGGTPSGFRGKGGEILKLILLAKNSGTTKLDFERFSVFLNDGRGTEISPERKAFTLKIVPRPAETTVKDGMERYTCKRPRAAKICRSSNQPRSKHF